MMKIFFYSSMSSATSVRERGAAGPIIRKSSSSPPAPGRGGRTYADLEERSELG